jgi:hypothetical protein
MRPTAILLVLCAAPPAGALTQPAHQDVTARTCSAAGLPASFCAGVARAAYDTDAESWEDPSAHAQLPEGGEACAGADATLSRLGGLAGSVREHLAAARGEARPGPSLGDAARDLGRALHTLEDACAHEGMPNSQHAALTDSDLCHGTQLSPDVQPAALVCAEDVANEVFAELLAALADLSIDPATLDQADATAWTVYPNLGEVCDFMHSAPSWDGVDRRWNSDVVLPRLRDAVGAELSGRRAAATVCPRGPQEIARPAGAPQSPLGAGESCAEIDAFCLASDATRNDIVPPFYDVDGFRGLWTTEGCSIAPRPRGAAAPSLLLAAGALLTSRGRRRSRAAGRGTPARAGSPARTDRR